MLHRREGIDELAGLKRDAAIDELAIGERLERFAEFAGRVIGDNYFCRSATIRLAGPRPTWRHVGRPWETRPW